jgi:hypothetical protein
MKEMLPDPGIDPIWMTNLRILDFTREALTLREAQDARLAKEMVR